MSEEPPLTSLHLLLTYRCNFECDHCFVFGSPSQEGVMTLAQIREIFRQAHEVEGIDEIYLEGGEPMLYYPILETAIREAHEQGFSTGLVSNGYWATTEEDAVAWLRPFAGRLDYLSVSTDLFHSDEIHSESSRHARAAAESLGIPIDTIVCEKPKSASDTPHQEPGGPVEGGAILFKGRAVEKLAPDAQLPRQAWDTFSACPSENFERPGRVHVDPLGNLHICQGVVMGNLFEKPLTKIIADFKPHADPIIGPLLSGGPTALVQHHKLSHADRYLDACHLCFEARTALRKRFGGTLRPAQMYGVGSNDR
jgi:hypothetical protein